MAIKNLPDNQLIESYHKAKELDLEPDFIKLLCQEINRRNLRNELKRDRTT